MRLPGIFASATTLLKALAQKVSHAWSTFDVGWTTSDQLMLML